MTSGSTLTLRARPAGQFGTLVVPVGLAAHAAGASDAAALQCTALLARTSGAHVVLVHVFSVPQDWYCWEPTASEAEAAVRELQAKAEHRLVQAAQTLYYEGVPDEVIAVRRVDVTEGIVGTARDVGADLIVMGTRGVSALHDGSSVTERVAVRAPCSVVAVHRAGEAPLASSPSFPKQVRRVLLVTGLGDDAGPGGHLALALAAQHTAHLDVFVLALPRSHVTGALGRATDGARPAQHVWHRERLSALLSAQEGDWEQGRDGESLVEAEAFSVSGPAEVVRLAAVRHPDLLVLAGVPDESLGSLADALATQIPCTVLVHEPKA